MPQFSPLEVPQFSSGIGRGQEIGDRRAAPEVLFREDVSKVADSRVTPLSSGSEQLAWSDAPRLARRELDAWVELGIEVRLRSVCGDSAR